MVQIFVIGEDCNQLMESYREHGDDGVQVEVVGVKSLNGEPPPPKYEEIAMSNGVDAK